MEDLGRLTFQQDYSNYHLNPKTSPTNSPQQLIASEIGFYFILCYLNVTEHKQ